MKKGRRVQWIKSSKHSHMSIIVDMRVCPLPWVISNDQPICMLKTNHSELFEDHNGVVPHRDQVLVTVEAETEWRNATDRASSNA